MPMHVHGFWQVILSRKSGQTDLVLACNQGWLVGVCVLSKHVVNFSTLPSFKNSLNSVHFSRILTLS